MDTDGFTDTDQATNLVGAALTAVRDGAFWKLLPDDLLHLGRQLEHLFRTVYAAQVHLAGEVDTAALATARSCPSTAVLLRHSLNISSADAIGRVKAARQILPRQQLTGPDAPPLLPKLCGALDEGLLGSDSTGSAGGSSAVTGPTSATTSDRSLPTSPLRAQSSTAVRTSARTMTTTASPLPVTIVAPTESSVVSTWVAQSALVPLTSAAKAPADGGSSAGRRCGVALHRVGER